MCKRKDTTDPFLRELLDKFGLHLLMPARVAEHLSPGTLLLVERDGVARRAAFKSVFGVEPSAKIDPDGVPPKLTVTTSTAYGADTGAAVTGGILASFGVTAAKLKSGLARKNVAKITMAIIAPTRMTLSNFDAMLDTLRQASAAPTAPYENRRMFVVTDVFTGTGLRVTTFDATDAAVKVDAALARGQARGGQLSGGVSLKVTATKNGTLDFTASQPLAFGFAAQEIYFEGGMLLDKNAQRVLKVRTADAPNARAWLSDETFIEVAD